jgi:hypothetical protein
MTCQRIPGAESTHPSSTPSSASASRRFGRYKDEESKSQRDPDIQGCGVVQELKMLFLVWNDTKLVSNMEASCHDKWYESAHSLITSEGVSFSRKELESFLLEMPELDGIDEFRSKAGLFLSALIGCGKDDDYELHVGHLGRLDNLCYRNCKDVIVHGHVGDYFANKMENGNVMLYGDAGLGAGADLEGDQITIHGDATNFLGNFISGGLIHVKGNVGDYLGEDMTGGQIIVEGNTGMEIARLGSFDIPLYCDGGKIIVNGRIGGITPDIPSMARIFLGNKMVYDGVAMHKVILNLADAIEFMGKDEMQRIFPFLKISKDKAVITLPLEEGDDA